MALRAWLAPGWRNPDGATRNGATRHGSPRMAMPGMHGGGMHGSAMGMPGASGFGMAPADVRTPMVVLFRYFDTVVEPVRLSLSRPPQGPEPQLRPLPRSSGQPLRRRRRVPLDRVERPSNPVIVPPTRFTPRPRSPQIGASRTRRRPHHLPVEQRARHVGHRHAQERLRPIGRRQEEDEGPRCRQNLRSPTKRSPFAVPTFSSTASVWPVSPVSRRQPVPVPRSRRPSMTSASTKTSG